MLFISVTCVIVFSSQEQRRLPPGAQLPGVPLQHFGGLQAVQPGLVGGLFGGLFPFGGAVLVSLLYILLLV